MPKGEEGAAGADKRPAAKPAPAKASADGERKLLSDFQPGHQRFRINATHTMERDGKKCVFRAADVARLVGEGWKDLGPRPDQRPAE